ncbi:MAG: outer rane efflux protein [Geminicoccaceae bacterium]|nr:outer rane efflux protein [Geminicoccaceae bacterium]
MRRLQPAMAALAAMAAGACVGTPSVGGVAGVAPSSSAPWTPPVRTQGADTANQMTVPADLAPRIRQLTMAEVVDLGLRNNPQTRVSWANARAAAAAYGSERGAYLPTIDGEVTGTRLKTVASQGRSAVTQSVLSPSLSLTYLLFDFGGRSGTVGAARNSLLAANYTHNATLQDVVLQIQTAYFQYVANQALLRAQQTTVREARTNLEAAEARRRVGVATIADVLQARTAASQAELAAETTEGDLLTSRGALALALGLPANLPYDIDSTAGQLPISVLADSVDGLITRAVELRPDLAAARADFEASRSQISVARASRLPSLVLNGSGGRTYTTTLPNGGNNYTVSLGLRIPIFAGFSRIYDQQEAVALADAAQARASALGQQVAFQVFSSYYSLQTAARRVATTQDLIASAEQSNEVALARYRAGVGSVLDLLSAQSALADARAQQVLGRLEWNTSLAQLAHDSGVLDPRGGSSLRLEPDSTAPTQR